MYKLIANRQRSNTLPSDFKLSPKKEPEFPKERPTNRFNRFSTVINDTKYPISKEEMIQAAGQVTKVTSSTMQSSGVYIGNGYVLVCKHGINDDITVQFTDYITGQKASCKGNLVEEEERSMISNSQSELKLIRFNTEEIPFQLNGRNLEEPVKETPTEVVQFGYSNDELYVTYSSSRITSFTKPVKGQVISWSNKRTMGVIQSIRKETDDNNKTLFKVSQSNGKEYTFTHDETGITRKSFKNGKESKSLSLEVLRDNISDLGEGHVISNPRSKPGMSGGPIFYIDNGKLKLLSIHTGQGKHGGVSLMPQQETQRTDSIYTGRIRLEGKGTITVKTLSAYMEDNNNNICEVAKLNPKKKVTNIFNTNTKYKGLSLRIDDEIGNETWYNTQFQWGKSKDHAGNQKSTFATVMVESELLDLHIKNNPNLSDRVNKAYIKAMEQSFKDSSSGKEVKRYLYKKGNEICISEPDKDPLRVSLNKDTEKNKKKKRKKKKELKNNL